MSSNSQSTGSALKNNHAGRSTVGKMKGQDRVTFVTRMPRREYAETLGDLRDAIRAYGGPDCSNSVIVRVALEYLADHLPGITQYGMQHLVTMAVHKCSKKARKGYNKESGKP